MNIVYLEAPKTEKVYNVVLNLNRRARLEQLKEYLIEEDFKEFKRTATAEDLDDFYFTNAVKLIAKHTWKYSRKLTKKWKEPLFDPAKKEDYFHHDPIHYLAYDKDIEKAIGYSSWTYSIQYKQRCFAQQVFVLPEYRRKGIATQLIKIHLPNITAILADTVNEYGLAMYEKNFDMSKVIIGRIYPHMDNRWIPANGREFIKQIKAFDPNAEQIFVKTPEWYFEAMQHQDMILLFNLMDIAKKKGVF